MRSMGSSQVTATLTVTVLVSSSGGTDESCARTIQKYVPPHETPVSVKARVEAGRPDATRFAGPGAKGDTTSR